MTQNVDEIEISPLDLLGGLVRRWRFLCLCGLLCAFIALAGSFLLNRQEYCCDILFYVSSGADTSGGISSSDMDAARELVAHYAVLVQTRPCLEAIAEAAGTELDAVGLTAEAVGTTAMLRLTVTGKNVENVALIAEAAASAVPQYVAGLIPGSAAEVVEPPATPIAVNSVNYGKNAVLGFAAGLLIGIILVFTAEIVTACRKGKE